MYSMGEVEIFEGRRKHFKREKKVRKREETQACLYTCIKHMRTLDEAFMLQENKLVDFAR